MSNSYSWLAREKTDPHQCKAYPRQPVLAGLTVSVEECPDALRHRDRGVTPYYLFKG